MSSADVMCASAARPHCYIAGDIMFSRRLVSDFMLALFMLGQEH